MRRVAHPILIFVVGVFFLACGGTNRPGSGGSDQIPNFDVKLLSGGTIGKKDLKGSVAILDFWATWCRPCISEIPFYNKIHEEYGDRKVIVLGIVLDPGSESVLNAFVKKHKMAYRIGLGNYSIARDFGGIRSVPTTFIVDRKGAIRKVLIGASSIKEGKIRQQLKRLLEE